MCQRYVSDEIRSFLPELRKLTLVTWEMKSLTVGRMEIFSKIVEMGLGTFGKFPWKECLLSEKECTGHAWSRQFLLLLVLAVKPIKNKTSNVTYMQLKTVRQMSISIARKMHDSHQHVLLVCYEWLHLLRHFLHQSHQ
jgi:hypothetical protein